MAWTGSIIERGVSVRKPNVGSSVYSDLLDQQMVIQRSAFSVQRTSKRLRLNEQLVRFDLENVGEFAEDQ